MKLMNTVQAHSRSERRDGHFSANISMEGSADTKNVVEKVTSSITYAASG